jgi:hypothetical protein
MTFDMATLRAVLASKAPPEEEADPYSPLILSTLAQIRKQITRVANAPRQSPS